MKDRHSLVWTDSSGVKHRLFKMNTMHLLNCIDKLEDKKPNQFMNGMYASEWLFQMKKEVCRRYSGTFSVPQKRRA